MATSVPRGARDLRVEKPDVKHWAVLCLSAVAVFGELPTRDDSTVATRAVPTRPTPMITTACPSTDSSAIARVQEHWLAAYRQRDLARVMSFFDSSTVAMFPNTPDQERRVVEAKYGRAMERPDRQWLAAIQAVDCAGDLGYLVSRWYYVTEAPTNGVVRVDTLARQRGLVVLRRGADRTWKIVRMIVYPDTLAT